MAAEGGQAKKLILFLDCGDTIIDEGTQVFDDEGTVIRADVIPGADIMVKKLAALGYTLALVADGRAQSFKNILVQNGVYDAFAALIYSEMIRAEKPSPRMFKAALGALDLSEKDSYRVAMVGNNLSRDVRGANQMGMISIHLDWTPRYPKTPADALEQPSYTISEPLELVDLAEKLNRELSES